ncbi:hypothetical protein EDD21DRAFT_382568 [Dissophora ornata]|nr:hypothetical protein BGZ58_008551 [Dissophora ornata]KAI8598415.1 hypothetical protein EDD21DRAFT_382568 [Dissophora ornata]
MAFSKGHIIIFLVTFTISSLFLLGTYHQTILRPKDRGAKPRFIFVDLGAKGADTLDVFMQRPGAKFKFDFPRPEWATYEQAEAFLFEANPVFNSHLVAAKERYDDQGIKVNIFPSTVVNVADGICNFSPNTINAENDASHPDAISSKSTGTDLTCINISTWLLRNTLPRDFVVVKMDIAGAEYEVIPHMAEMGAWTVVDNLLVKWHGADVRGGTPEEISYRNQSALAAKDKLIAEGVKMSLLSPTPPLDNNHPTENVYQPIGEISGSDALKALRLPDEHNNTTPDFSRVGYREGSVPIPTVPVRVILKPSMNQAQDDTARIQYAIDQVSAMPLVNIGENGAAVRGAVLFKAGVYRVAGALIIHSSGVVLRGEGQDELGTIIIATGTIQRDFILVNGMLTSDMGTVEMQQSKARTNETMPVNEYEEPRKPITNTRAGIYIPAGETRIPVESVAGYEVGDRIVIERPASDEWIHDLGMDQLPERPDNEPVFQWTKEEYNIKFERTIVGIEHESNTFVIDIPIVMNLDPKYPPAKIFELIYKFPVISDVGIENLRLLSTYDHTNLEDEDHAWIAVVLDNVIHSWISDVTIVHFISGIVASAWSRYTTIQDSTIMDPVSKFMGGRRYQFDLSGQMGLVKRCFSRNGRHDFITQAGVYGPNVFVDSTGVNSTNDSGPHERFAVGSLYDNIVCDKLNVRQRLWFGTGQGWSGAFHVLYNCSARKNRNMFQDPPGTTNWIIGFKGGLDQHPWFDGRRSQMVTLDSSVEQPRSLYWAQLINRMGGDEQLVETTVGTASKRRYS